MTPAERIQQDVEQWSTYHAFVPGGTAGAFCGSRSPYENVCAQREYATIHTNPLVTKTQFEALGHSEVKTLRGKLEFFKTPKNVASVTMTSDEVTAVCPVTGQPDFYTVEIEYFPKEWCIESKSLKLYLQEYRTMGIFGEQFASIIADHVFESIKPDRVRVLVTQKARGGITIETHAWRDE